MPAASLLGRVYYEKHGSPALIPFVTGIEAAIDAQSTLSAPLTVAEMIIDKKYGAAAEILALANLSLDTDEVYELRVIDNAAAKAVTSGAAWRQALDDWRSYPETQALLGNAAVSAVSVVTGVVQKYLTSKKYGKFEAGAKGGYAGINVEGKLYTSSSHFQLNVVYGIDLVSFGVRSDPVMLPEEVFTYRSMDAAEDINDMVDKFEVMAREYGMTASEDAVLEGLERA